MPRSIESVLGTNDGHVNITNESIERTSEMISRVCEKYGTDFAGKYVHGLMEDTEVTEANDNGDNKEQDVNTNQQNSDQNNQQNNQSGNQQNTNNGVQDIDKIINDYNVVYQTIQKFVEGHKDLQWAQNLQKQADGYKNGLENMKKQADQNNQQQNNQNNQNNQNDGNQQQNNQQNTQNNTQGNNQQNGQQQNNQQQSNSEQNQQNNQNQ